jgi:uncharacterized protein with ATP-grasp and redox domains
MTSDPGSFARQTIVERKPEIIRRVLEDNPYPKRIVAALTRFQAEIASGIVQPLREEARDVPLWHTHWQPHAGRSWLALPWYFAETYFYRRLLEAVDYFQPGPFEGLDPFAVQKRAQEATAAEQILDVWGPLMALHEDVRFAPLLHACLWGNRADLSNFTVKEQAIGNTLADREHILIDHTAEVEALLHSGVEEIAFISDNVGADSLFDLILADHLLTLGRAKRVVFHLKPQPFFVSDAMPADINHIVRRLHNSPAVELVDLAARLERARSSSTLRLATDPFWATSLFLTELPAPVHEELERADLIILKGDVNYRRLLEDRHWPPTTDLGKVAASFPRPFLVLRTLKGEIIAGLQPGQAEALSALEPDWLISGKRGLIHLVRDAALDSLPFPTEKRTRAGSSHTTQA